MEKYNPLVSVIIPVFNTPICYMERCINSLLNQTFGDFEVLIIDDGSEDKLAVRYEEFSKADKRIKILHKKNGGVSSARNMGINEACGKYISFVDGDDWVSADYLELLVSGLEKYNSDLSIVEANYCYSEEDEKKDNVDSKEYIVLDKNRFYEQMLNSETIGGYLCNKMFKRSMVEQLRLNENLHYCEDFEFAARYCQNIAQVCFVSRKAYHYWQREQSARCLTVYNSRIFSLLEARKRINEIYAVECPEQMIRLEKDLLKVALNLRARYKFSKANNTEQYDVIKQVIDGYIGKVIKTAGFCEAINLALTFCFPKTAIRIKSETIRRKRKC